ncbi:four-helix bundle copper-binding protein [soil metagenome]
MANVNQHPNTEMQQCIQNCQTCHTVCLQMIAHCLDQGGKHAEAAHIKLLLDCAEICQTSANFMIRNSELHMEACRACAVICERCALDCERFEDDGEMKNCAQVCRRCAESCQRMAKMAMQA